MLPYFLFNSMFYPVMLFRSLCTVPTVQISHKVSRNSSYSWNVVASADWAYVIYYCFKSAFSASVNGVVYWAVANLCIFHRLHYFKEYRQVLSCFAVKLYVCYVSSPCYLVERGLLLNLVEYAYVVLNINVEWIDVIIPVCNVFNCSVFFPVNS